MNKDNQPNEVTKRIPKNGTGHSLLPWGFGKTSEDKKLILSNGGVGKYVCSVQIHQTPRVMGTWEEDEREANAALIVKAVNNHYALLEALKESMRALSSANVFARNAQAAITAAEVDHG